MKNKKEHLNPEELFKSPAFPQLVTTQGNGKTIYIGGQNSINEKLVIIGKEDITAQTEQVMKNLGIALKSSGASFADLVKLNIYIVQGQDVQKGFEASRTFLEKSSNPPIVTVLFVAGLGRPEFLVEIDAIAFIPEP